MDSRVQKSINKLENLKQKKLTEKEKIEQELSSINSDLKRLYTFKSEQDKLQTAINDFYQPINKVNDEWHSRSVLYTSKHWIRPDELAC